MKKIIYISSIVFLALILYQFSSPGYTVVEAATTECWECVANPEGPPGAVICQINWSSGFDNCGQQAYNQCTLTGGGCRVD